MKSFVKKWGGLAVTVLALAGCGTPVSAPAARHGIVSLAPNLTETVFALGQGSRVVGIGSFDDYPPEATVLPRLGGYIDPDLEKLTLLMPELIIVPGQHQKVTDFAAMKDIRVLNVNMDSLITIDQGIGTIGEALGCADRAQALRSTIKSELDAVRAAVAGRPRPKVLVLHMRPSHDFNSLYTVGGPSFVSELVGVAGGENIFASNPQNYFEASKESIVVGAPEVVLEFHAGESLSPEEQAQWIADWQQFDTLPAVKNHRVYLIIESYALRPGPRVAMIARELARLLHPDAPRPAS